MNAAEEAFDLHMPVTVVDVSAAVVTLTRKRFRTGKLVVSLTVA